MEQWKALDLGSALDMSGVEGDFDQYTSVVVRIVPAWLSRVWGTGIDAMTLPRTVFASEDAMRRIHRGEAPTLLIHESAHVDQWRRFGRVGFLTRYLGDYVKGRAVGLPHHTAYRAIRFERQAVERAERP
jgi:hypothetical protein